MKYALTFMSTGREEHQSLIRLLVRRILDELSNTPMRVASYTVGLNSRVEDLMKLLDVKSNGIQVSGFHGMGGVGKTTLAKALYNKLVSQFEHRSFISNVREASMQPNGLVFLQRKLLGDLSLGKASGVNDVSAGKIAIKGILNDKRVLVVLDDVDDVSQLGALAIKREWFYEGSRIIITTRDRNVLLADRSLFLFLCILHLRCVCMMHMPTNSIINPNRPQKQLPFAGCTFLPVYELIHALATIFFLRCRPCRRLYNSKSTCFPSYWWFVINQKNIYQVKLDK